MTTSTVLKAIYSFLNETCGDGTAALNHLVKTSTHEIITMFLDFAVNELFTPGFKSKFTLLTEYANIFLQI